MSSFQKPKIASFKADGDLSSKQFHAVKFSSADYDVVDADAGEGFGILMNKPLDNEMAEVAVSGGAKAKLGSGGATRGVSLKADADGKLVACSDGDDAICMAEASGVENDVIPVIVDRHQA